MPYVCVRTIGAFWAINEPDNAWVWVNDLGWRKLDTSNTRNLLLVAARAKMDGSPVNLAEEIQGDRTIITQITPVPLTPAATEVSRSVSDGFSGGTAAYPQPGPHLPLRTHLTHSPNNPTSH